MPKRLNLSNDEELAFYWFGKCARLFRERMGLSQKDISLFSDGKIHQNLVSHLERGGYFSCDAYDKIKAYSVLLIDYHMTCEYPGKADVQAPFWLYSVVNEGPLFASAILEKWFKDQRLSDEEHSMRPEALYWLGKCFKMIRTRCFYNVPEASRCCHIATKMIQELESHNGSSYMFTDKMIIKLTEGIKTMLKSDTNFERISEPEWVTNVQKNGVQNSKNDMRNWYILMLDQGAKKWH